GTVNPQTGQPTLEDSVAKMRADSVMAAINTGADFKQMVTKYSTDEGSVANGGEYKNITYGSMVPEFNEFIFTKPVGSRGVVKTQFGYHIIEVLNQKGSSPVYKIAFMAKDIQPSEATINKAQLDANKLAAQKESKAFEEYIKKNGLQKISSNNLIKENDSRVGGDLPDARPLVRWAFEAKKGEVSDVYNMVDKFVVAVVDKIYKEGTQDAETARPMVENVVRNQKKAEQIIKNLGANPTLEKAAAAYGKEIQTAGLDSSLVFSNSSIQNIGFEPKLVGSVFNKENMNKVAAPLAGRNMVYVFRVNGIASKPADTEAESAAFRSQQTTALRNLLANWFEDLRKRATIKDNRSEFY
ncbi:MAG TPA: peptidylprolyl isomerase, partial [Ferruginibacter sp.]|nr:peptidylprolyl isomerase [Ferruginibacter sp.]HNN72638.1 peptidylprolyl isomerase [Ferruginibacter sp.]